MMTCKEIKSALNHKMIAYLLKVKSTENDLHQFETNCRHIYIGQILEKNIKNLEKHEAYLGQTVYKYVKSCSYSLIQNPDHLNRTYPEPIIFTEELLDKFANEALQFWINYYVDCLVKGEIYQKSTNPLSNLYVSWKNEMIQQLIGLYKDLLATNKMENIGKVFDDLQDEGVQLYGFQWLRINEKIISLLKKSGKDFRDKSNVIPMLQLTIDLKKLPK